MTVVVREDAVRCDPTRATSVRGRETRQRILDAARVRIARDGFEALRLDDLARDAGVSKAAVVKSAAARPAILLAIGEEDRQTDSHDSACNGTSKRVAPSPARRCAEMLTLDVPRLNIVMAYIGHMWFWRKRITDRAVDARRDARAVA